MPSDKAPERAPEKSGQKPASTNEAGLTTQSTNPAGATSDATADTKNTDTDLLSAAAASSDAAVHQVLGEREIAARNGDEDALKDLDDRLRGLIEK